MKETVGRSVGMLSNLIRRHFSTFSFHGTLSGAQGKTLHFILVRGQECDVFQKDIEEEYSLRPPTATKLEETEDRLTSGISPQDLAVFFRVINQMIRNMS